MQDSSTYPQKIPLTREARKPMSIKETKKQADEKVEKITTRLFELLLTLNGYDVIALLMLVLAAAIDGDGNNRVLNFVYDHTGGLLAPWLWKYAFIVCGAVQLSARLKHLKWTNIAMTLPMVAIGFYFVLYALSGRPGPVSPFSTLLIVSMAVVLLLFILRTTGFEHYREREQLLLMEITRLRANQVKPDEQ